MSRFVRSLPATGVIMLPCPPVPSLLISRDATSPIVSGAAPEGGDLSASVEWSGAPVLASRNLRVQMPVTADLMQDTALALLGFDLRLTVDLPDEIAWRVAVVLELFDVTHQPYWLGMATLEATGESRGLAQVLRPGSPLVRWTPQPRYCDAMELGISLVLEAQGLPTAQPGSRAAAELYLGEPPLALVTRPVWPGGAAETGGLEP